MERDRRLARAGRAADHHVAGGGAGDQVELLRVDQAGDVRQPLVRALGTALRVGTELPIVARVHGVDAQRHAFAAAQLRGFARGVPPAVRLRVVLEERPLRRVDPLQVLLADRHRAPGFDRALVDAAGDVLFVVVALLVAVEELGDGRVAPVDDAQPVVEAGRLAEAELADVVALAQPEVGEVGRLRIHLRHAARLAELLEQRTLHVPARVQ
jgi:hypothetical protein